MGSAGAYIPGGKYPLTASAHMTIITAKVAGVPRVVACTPPIKGEIPAATVAAMHLAGADEIWILGGVQAVASMALGTEAMDRVDMIAGPGNAYVAEAKRPLYGEVGIDLFAGPTEILVIADADADPFVVAVDLLSQAEHGPESPAILVTTSTALGEQVMAHIEQILPAMPTRDYAEPAWRDFGQDIVVNDLDEAFAVADSFAAEHVQVLTENPRQALDKMRDFGALSWARTPASRTGTRSSAPTTGCLPSAPPATPANSGREVPQDRHLPGGHRRGLQRRARPRLRSRRGVELFEGHARSGDVRPGSSRATSTTGSTRRSRPAWWRREGPDARRGLDARYCPDARYGPQTRNKNSEVATATGPLTGRTALVTGGGTGLGAAITRALHGRRLGDHHRPPGRAARRAGRRSTG